MQYNVTVTIQAYIDILKDDNLTFEERKQVLEHLTRLIIEIIDYEREKLKYEQQNVWS